MTQEVTNRRRPTLSLRSAPALLVMAVALLVGVGYGLRLIGAGEADVRDSRGDVRVPGQSVDRDESAVPFDEPESAGKPATEVTGNLTSAGNATVANSRFRMKVNVGAATTAPAVRPRRNDSGQPR